MAITLEALNDQEQYDVVVVGAGMVGASAALGISALGLSVLVVDSFAFKETVTHYTPSYDARSTAVSWGSREILDRLGVWSNVAQHASAIENVHVSEKGRFGVTRISAEALKFEALGYVVPNQWLGQCLLQKLDEKKVPLCAPSNVTRIIEDDGQQLIQLESVGSTPTITKEIKGEIKEHRFIRSDVISNKSDADELMVRKSKMLIDQMNESIFN